MSSRHYTKPPERRERDARHGRRRTPHPFVPQAGHPDLCAGCNAGKDETLAGGRFIHTVSA